MWEFRGGPARGMFPGDGGARGQMPPWFAGGHGFSRGGGPAFSQRFPGGGGPADWGAPVCRPPPPFSPNFRPCGPRFSRPGGPSQRQFNPHSQWYPNHFPPQAQPQAPAQDQWINQQQNSNGNKRKNKKPSVDKRELPENNRFYCDICDRGFKTKELHTLHVDGHEKCRVEGCSYTAAPKLVRLHFNLQHKTGLAKKIWQLESKEDLEKWRADRKKNFPTAANVAKKLSVQADRIARGEVLETKRFGKFAHRGRGGNRGRGKGGRGRGGSANCHHVEKAHDSSAQKRSHDLHTLQTNASSPPKKQKIEITGTSVMAEKTIPLGTDPLSFVLQGGAMDSDEEADAVTAMTHDDKMAAAEPAVSAAGGLGSLISSYASDSEDEPVEQPLSENLPQQNGTKETLAHEPETREPLNTNTRRKPQRRRSKRGKGNNDTNLKPHKSTLLEKLLAPEIRHERNVILQCVRYIVKKGFFGIGDKTETQESSCKGRQLKSLEVFNDEIWENGL